MRIVFPAYINRYRFYILTGLAMFIWIAFFDNANLITQFRQWRKLKSYESQKEYYTEQIEQVKKERKEVMGNAKAMEQFAREKYLMKKSNETVFVLVDENGKLIDETNH